MTTIAINVTDEQKDFLTNYAKDKNTNITDLFTLFVEYLEKLESSENPKAYGKELSGNMVGMYRFRVNDYRIVAKFIKDTFIVQGLGVGHRKNIYKILESRI